MKLLTNENNANALKIIIASRISQKKLDICQDFVENLKSPTIVPQLVLNSGTHIFSSNASVNYLCPPTTQHETSIVNHYLDLEAAVIQPHAVLYYNSKVNDQCKKSFDEVLKLLDEALSSKAFLAGDKITAADIAIWSTIYPLTTDSKSSKDLFSNKPSLKKWFDSVHTLPSVQDTLKTYSIKEDAIPFGKSAQVIKTLTATTKTPGPGSTSTQKINQCNTQQENVVKEPAIVVTKEEKEGAVSAWQGKGKTTSKPAVRPVLPVPGERNILITSALPYVNNVPHLGNIIGCVLSGDVFARYCRLRGYNTLYVCGTDEYGTATETKAVEEGLTPQEICDKYFKIHDAIYKWFDISFDYFGRTTTSHQTDVTDFEKESQTVRYFLEPFGLICQDIFKKVYDNGFVLAESVEQLLCEKCDRYLADRFVEGTCPRCAYDDARGDQCDGCGHLINAPELIKPRCKMCKETPVLRESQQFFLDLPKIEPVLKEWIQKSSLSWSHNAREISKAWLNDGLKPRCITRDLKWGIPVPLDGYRNKVFYVWFDAPIGYISITKLYTEKWKKWWMPDKGTDVRLYQFMAKDNVPFHSVMFPASLLATKENFVLVNNIYATEYLNYEDGKFSKSRGVGVFGNDAQDTGIPADIWRFYLLYVRPESQDSSFSWVDLALKNNSELLNILGNFINRALVFCEKNHNCTVPEIDLTEEDQELLALVNRELTEYISALEKGKLRDGIRHTLSIARLGNQLMQASQPWVLCKGTDAEKRRCETVIGLSINLSCLLSQLLYPYMPNTSEVIRKQLNSPPEVNFIDDKFRLLLPPGHRLGKPFPLFHKIEVDHIEKLKSKFAGRQKSASPSCGGDSHKTVNLSHGEDVASLEAAVAAQGDVVRKMKSAGKEKSEWQPQVAILLDLKKKLAEAQAKAKESTPASVSGSTSGKSVQELEEEVKKQGDHVRKLKGSGVDRSQWQPEVNILLDLKKQLAEAQAKAKDSTPASVNSSAPVNVSSSTGSEKSVEELEEEVRKQGDQVRELKGSGVDRSQWQPEVNILLDLKKQLAEAQAKAKPSTPANVTSSPPANTSNSTSGKSVEALEEEVAKQGDVVRKLKESGVDRSQWQPEVNILLDLKKQLAELKGEPLPASSSKKNKKK